MCSAGMDCTTPPTRCSCFMVLHQHHMKWCQTYIAGKCYCYCTFFQSTQGMQCEYKTPGTQMELWTM
jgi:hypothetical protein